jgi:glucosamine--fructose-6-phosphate aminotransferase (isomerizing)
MIGQEFVVDDVLARLKRMEYRGYDSFGYWDGKQLLCKIGTVAGDAPQKTTFCLGHTRWATHGKVTEANAHPHRAGKTTIVHNGIIENWKELKEEAKTQGATFASETDSEVIAWFIEQERQTQPMEEVLKKFVDVFKGTFATVIMIDGEDKLYAAKRGSPLLFGTSDTEAFFSSDIYAFSDLTKKAVVFDDDEYAIISPQNHTFYKDGAKIKKSFKEFAWVEKDIGLGEHEHHMHKEIYDQPSVSDILLTEIENDKSFDKLREAINNAKKVVFTAC